MRQLLCIRGDQLANVSNWVGQMRQMLDVINFSTIYVSLFSSLDKKAAKRRKEMHQIKPMKKGSRGKLTGHPSFAYKWHASCDRQSVSIDISGTSTKDEFLALLADMQQKGFCPGNIDDLLCFIHEPM